jgi:hypothetical protein
MIRWIRRIAFGIGVATFFALFAVGIAAAGRFSWDALVPIGIRALVGAGSIWVVGIIVADIIVKGIAADMPPLSADSIEDGLVRRLASAAGNRNASGVEPAPSHPEVAQEVKTGPRENGR